jgi:threonine/homoserine/homoserine lactone efflux protein
MLFLQLFMPGFLISLTGSLPLGNLNSAAMQIAAKENVRKALSFAGGVSLVEMVYLVIILELINRFSAMQHFFLLVHIASAVVLTAMSVAAFMATTSKEGKNILIDNHLNRGLLGIAMSAANPVQFPFWGGWVLYLVSQSLLPNSILAHALFTVSAGAGTFIAMLVFIVAGWRFASILRKRQKLVNMVLGSLFAVMAIVECIKIF